MTLPAGTYRVKAVASGVGLSNSKFTPFVRVTFRVLDGPELAQEVDWIAYSTPKTQERLARDMRTLGFQGNELEVLHNRGEDEVGKFLPSIVSIVVEHEEWQGSPRERVKWINPERQEPSQGGLFAGMKAAFAALDQSAKKPAGGAIPRPAPAPAPAPELSDDDVPF